MPKYTDGSLAYGVFLNGLPPVINPPEGWALRKLRLRSDEIIRAVYTKGNNTAVWAMQYTEDRKALEPGWTLSANIRE